MNFSPMPVARFKVDPINYASVKVTFLSFSVTPLSFSFDASVEFNETIPCLMPLFVKIKVALAIAKYASRPSLLQPLRQVLT